MARRRKRSRSTRVARRSKVGRRSRRSKVGRRSRSRRSKVGRRSRSRRSKVGRRMKRGRKRYSKNKKRGGGPMMSRMRETCAPSLSAREENEMKQATMDALDETGCVPQDSGLEDPRAKEIFDLFAKSGELDKDGYKAFLQGVDAWGEREYTDAGWDTRWPKECKGLGCTDRITESAFMKTLYGPKIRGPRLADDYTLAVEEEATRKKIWELEYKKMKDSMVSFIMEMGGEATLQDWVDIEARDTNTAGLGRAQGGQWEHLWKTAQAEAALSAGC